MTSSNLVDRMTGRSAGFSPLRHARLDAGLAISLGYAGSITHQAAGHDRLAAKVHRRQLMASRQRGDLFAA